MKINYGLLMLLLLIFQKTVAQSFSQFRKGDSIVSGMGCSQGFYEDYKFVPKDIISYEHIQDNYGKDLYNVYYNGKPLKDINPNNTTLAYAKKRDSTDGWYSYNNLFITDGHTTYCDGVAMQNVDVKNIYFMSDGRIPLFRSNNNTYFKGNLLKLDPKKTRIIDAHPNKKTNFFTDGIFVYKNEILVENANPNSFERSEYHEKRMVNEKYVYKNIADSQDENNYYNNGKVVKPYPNWKKTLFLPDSIDTKEYMVTFNSDYEKQDINATPPIDFYLSPKNIKELIRNIDLNRKKVLKLKEDITVEEKSYGITVLKNKKKQSSYYYNEDLEELDIDGFTKYDIIGDGFHFSKETFNLLRKNGSPIKYFKQEFKDYATWTQKANELGKNNNVITFKTTFYQYSPINKKGKRYKWNIYDYDINQEKKERTNLASYQGIFTFKIPRKKATEIMGDDIYSYSRREKIKKKNLVLTSLVSSGKYFIHTNNDINNENDIQWLLFSVFCSQEFAKQVPEKNIENEWQPIKYKIYWQEK